MERYSRQILFGPIGPKGQKLLASKHVLLVGAGALGSANAEMLVRAGVGRLTIVDRDYVEVSNLQRQQLYTEEDAKRKLPKAAAAKIHLEKISSNAEIEAVIKDGDAESLAGYAESADLVIDATDNFEIRMILNDLTQKLRKPFIYGACVSSYGMSYTVLPGKSPCLNCLLRAVPVQGMTCDTNGIIAPAVGMVVAHQQAEALKILTENLEAVNPGMVSFDLWANEYRNIKAGRMKKSDCPSCGNVPAYPYLARENTMKTAVLCGRDTVQIRPPAALEIDLAHLAAKLEAAGYAVKSNAFLLATEYMQERFVLFKDGRALIHGTKDKAQARKIYQQILG